MPEWAQDFASEVWFQTLVDGASAAVIVVFERLRGGASWPETIVLGLLAFASLVYLTGRFWKPSIRSRIRNWLDSGGYAVQTIEDKEFEFSFVAEIGNWKTIIRKNRNKKSRNVFIASYAVATPEPLRLALAPLELPARRRVLKPVAIEMYKYGANFDLGGIIEPGSLLVSEIIAVGDDMGEIDFQNTIRFVASGAKLLSELLLDLDPATIAAPNVARVGR